MRKTFFYEDAIRSRVPNSVHANPSFQHAVTALGSAYEAAILQRDYARAKVRLLQSTLRWDGGKGVDKHAKAKRRLKALSAKMRKAGVRP